MAKQSSIPQPPRWAEYVKVCEFQGVEKFYDIMPVLANKEAFGWIMSDLNELVGSLSKSTNISTVVSTEARGFLFGPAVACNFGIGFVPVRKPGKLPGKIATVDYAKEYGQDTLVIQQGLIKPGANVVVIDDLVATGGTLQATAELVKKMGGQVQGIVAPIELTELGGRKLLEDAGYTLLSAWAI